MTIAFDPVGADALVRRSSCCCSFEANITNHSITAPLPPPPSRPRGVFFIAALLCLSALASLTVAVLNFFGLAPLALGAFILGGGLEVLGPFAFAFYAIPCIIAATGLLGLRNWARWLTIAILLFGLVQVTPAVSMAVADGRIAAILREGLQIILRSAALWYLFQEPVRDNFS